MALTFVASGDKLTTPAFVVPTAVTYTAWVKSPDFVSSTGPRIFENVTPTTRWFLDSATSQFVYQRLFANTGEWRVAFPAGIDWTQWHHLAVTHDASATANVPKFYCDGVELTAVTTVTAPTGSVSANSEVMTVGNRPSNARQAGTVAWVGIYNAVLSAGGIAHAKSFGSYPFTQFAIWDLGTDGATFTDISNNARTATKVGTPTFLANPAMAGGPTGTSVLDHFNRADAAVGASWTADTFAFGNAGMLVIGNRAGSSAGDVSSYWNVGQFGPGCEVYATVPVLPAANGHVALNYRTASPATVGVDSYWLKVIVSAGTDTWELYRIVDQGFTLIGTFGQEVAAGDSVGVSVYGSTHRVMYKPSSGSWTQIGVATDATLLASGYIGAYINGTTARLEDFGGGTVAGPGVGSMLLMGVGV